APRLASPERHALELQRPVGDLLAAHLPQLDRALRQGRDLSRHLLQLLLQMREKLLVRGCAASTLQLDAHLPSWTLGPSILRGGSRLTARSCARSTPPRLPPCRL